MMPVADAESHAPLDRLRRLHAPIEDGGLLVWPDWPTASDWLAQPHDDTAILSRRLSELRAQAQHELVSAALVATRSYRDVAEPAADARVIVAGHQAELFHPGVWAKNFALDRFARTHQAVAVNLVVDTDLVKSTAITVPGPPLSAPDIATLAFDNFTHATPAEDRSILDIDLFRSFDSRVEDHLGGLIDTPVIRELWPLVVEQAEDHHNLALSLAQGRHRLEGSWGLETLELPLSSTSHFESFAWFVAHLLSELSRFTELFHEAILDYRRANKLRSKNHPFPLLTQHENWHEAPFWISSAESPDRRRLFVERGANTLTLSDRQGWTLEAPNDDAGLVDALRGLMNQGVRLRTRAVTTTLWARLFLGDVFLHGLGGAKYDQVTDRVMRTFYKIDPPGFMSVTATMRLPLDHVEVQPSDFEAIDQSLRRLTWNPQERLADVTFRSTADQQQVDRWRSEKERWIQTPQTPENARKRFKAIRAANECLQSWTAPYRAQLQDLRRDLVALEDLQRRLASRDWSFCLYPTERLRETLLHELAERSAPITRVRPR